ncbi:MAG TPA: hypothetical protein DDY16_04955 [Tenacibaculum sp.]|nr:hypothetical protein [Tenacibaculum sp.]
MLGWARTENSTKKNRRVPDNIFELPSNPHEHNSSFRTVQRKANIAFHGRFQTNYQSKDTLLQILTLYKTGG